MLHQLNLKSLVYL